MSAVPIVAAVLFACLAAVGAYMDARTRTIPNLLNALMAICGLAAVWLAAGANAGAWAAAHLAIALILGMVIYALGMWGGGDAKFYAAAAAWFELTDAFRLVLSISLAGLILVIGWFVTKRLRARAEGVRSRDLPYGVAIAAGGVALMATQTM